MRGVDFSKLSFILTFVVSIFICGVIYGAHSKSAQTILDHLVNSVALVILEWTASPELIPEHFLQPAQHNGSGVTVNDISEDRKELILLSGFFENTNELRLIGRDGAIIARWPVRYSEIFQDSSHVLAPPASDWTVEIHGALILPDGSVVFNFEYFGLVKLGRCGDLIWALAKPTHHSVERAEGGGYWVSGRRFYTKGKASPFAPFETPFREDTILKVSEDGEILAELSLPGIFYDNGLDAILTASGHNFRAGMRWDEEIVHLNKVEELTSDIADDFPLFEAGDLALSIRELNMVMVVDPADGRVKWWQIGPWLRQHDPEFKPGGTIAIFNNNMYEIAFGASKGTTDPSLPRVTNISEIDPVTRDTRIIYGGRKDQEILSIWRGKFDPTPNGGLFITESEAGRVLETDAAGHVIWEYINRFDENLVAELNEARLYPESYFSVADWSCESPPS